MDSKPLPQILKLLAHELRWQLVTYLANSDYRVQELCQIVDQPQNVVSYHLKQLRDAELVSEHRSSVDARDVYYHLNLPYVRNLWTEAGQMVHPVLSPPQPGAYVPAPNYPKRVLFLCTHNSARSQMAEGFLRYLSNGKIDVFSAGTEPTSVHPLAIRAMKEAEIDITKQRSKHIDKFAGQTFDYAITVCDRARENCPTFATPEHTLHWSFPDPLAYEGPQDKHYHVFAEIAHQLASRLRLFLTMSTAVNSPY